jgi:hypothetical protein
VVETVQQDRVNPRIRGQDLEEVPRRRVAGEDAINVLFETLEHGAEVR